MALTIRPAEVKDVELIYELSNDVHLKSYVELIAPEHRRRFLNYYEDTEEHRRRYIERRKQQLLDDNWMMYVAYEGGTLVGFEFSFQLPDHTIKLEGLFIRTDKQGQGIGSMLMRRVIQAYPPGTIFRLEVIETNTVAKGLYEKFGFYNVGVSERTYFGENMATMERHTID
jgi:ribosomal protein S18 acetylase RimI-like enzyme